MSFYLWKPFHGIKEFIGIENYLYQFQNPLFWKSLFNTLYFTAGALILTVVLGSLISGLIHFQTRGEGFYRAIYFLPVVTSMVAAALVWKFMYHSESGLFNSILMKMGFARVSFLQDVKLVMPSLIIVQAWKDLGYAIVLLLAGMNEVDKSLYESSYIDGANKMKQFIFITMPLTKRTMTILIITKIIDYMQVFTPVFFMTQGGPGTETHTITFNIYKDAFEYRNFGSASSVSFLLFAIIFVFSMMQLTINKTED